MRDDAIFKTFLFYTVSVLFIAQSQIKLLVAMALTISNCTWNTVQLQSGHLQHRIDTYLRTALFESQIWVARYFLPMSQHAFSLTLKISLYFLRIVNNNSGLVKLVYKTVNLTTASLVCGKINNIRSNMYMYIGIMYICLSTYMSIIYINILPFFWKNI